MRGAAAAAAAACVTALVGQTGLASAQLVVSSPAGLAPGLRAEVIAQYSGWGRQSVEVIDSEVFLIDNSKYAEYCAMVHEFERSGFVNRTFAERARGKVVFMGDGSYGLEQPCGSRFWWDMWTFYPCLLLGPVPVVTVWTSEFNFGGYVYSFPTAGSAPGPGRIYISSFADVTAELRALMPSDNETGGSVAECSLLNMLFVNTSGGGAINGELGPVLDALRAGESVRVNLHVTESRYKAVWEQPLVRVLFAGVFPALYFGTALLALKFFRVRLAIWRKTKAGLQGGKRVQLIVLAVNGCAMLVLGVMLAIDGYGVLGKVSDNVRNYFRPLLLGVASGSDILLAGLWDTTVQDQKLGTASHRKTAFQSQWVFRLALAVMTMDVVFGLAGIYLLGAGFLIFMIMPLAFLVIRVVVAVHLVRSTRRVLAMLTGYAAAALLDDIAMHVAAVQRGVQAQLILIRRLARCIKFAVVASVALALITLAMGMRIGYFLADPAPTMWMNGLFIFARWLSSHVTVLFCEPPPSAREIEHSLEPPPSAREIEHSLRVSQKILGKDSKRGSSSVVVPTQQNVSRASSFVVVPTQKNVPSSAP
jgi:hypothetical protein